MVVVVVPWWESWLEVKAGWWKTATHTHTDTQRANPPTSNGGVAAERVFHNNDDDGHRLHSVAVNRLDPETILGPSCLLTMMGESEPGSGLVGGGAGSKVVRGAPQSTGL